MTVITVTTNVMPTPGIYANMLIDILIEQGVDKPLAGMIGNVVEYGLFGLEQTYSLVDKMLATDSPGVLLSTLDTYFEMMATDSDAWRPTTADAYQSVEDYQRKLSGHSSLERACLNLIKLLTEFSMSYHAR